MSDAEDRFIALRKRKGICCAAVIGDVLWAMEEMSYRPRAVVNAKLAIIKEMEKDEDEASTFLSALKRDADFYYKEDLVGKFLEKFIYDAGDAHLRLNVGAVLT